jgi:hypothetical protein
MNKFDDIIPPSRRRESEPLSQGLDTKAPHAPRRRGRFPYLTMLIVLVVIAASAGALIYFSSAKIEIVPSTISATVQASLTANSSSGDLPFKVITAQKIASQSVQGGGTKTVNSSASGTITIYNTQAKPQALITNTRFATASGLIFRIHGAVTVPAGSAAKPGTVSAKVFADQAGSTYNVGPSSFTVPGFAGTPQASQVYARSITAMTGGASGTVPTVDAVAGAQARTALTAALAPDLAKSIQEQIAADYAGYVFVPGAATTTFQELDSAPSATSGMVDLKEQGTITAVIFPNAALAKAIAASSSGSNYQGEPLTISNTESLKLVPTAGIPTDAATTFSFTLGGTAPLVYTVDTARIAAAVAGKTRSAAEVALTNYPEVNRAIIVLRPFWKQSFPEDPTGIKIVVNNP